MKRIINQLAFIAIALGTTGCSSTTVEEIAKQGEKSDVVTVTAKAPVFSTRATSGYVLRYKAFLFEENINEDNETKSIGKFVAAQEQLDNNGATFLFNLTEIGNYVILFVADYIDPTSQDNKDIWIDKVQIALSGSGYKDDTSCYKIDFNTVGSKRLVMRSEEKAPYNNDNYEVFVGKESFTKGNDKVTISNVSLRRPVCKVIIKEKSESIAGLISEVTKYNAGIEYDLYKETVSAPREFKNEEKENGLMRSKIQLADVNNQELFFFYAFAEPTDEGTFISKDGMSFELSGGVVNFNYTISKDKLKFKPNNKYTLMGNFVRTDMGQVNITVKTDPKWDSESEQDI